MRSAGAALVAITVALAAGCGGDDGSDELAAEADPICARANAALAALDRPESLEQLLRYVDEATEVLETRRRELRALTPPEESEEWTAFLAADDRAIAAMADLRESTVTGRGGEEAIGEFEAAAADARVQAEALGLEACAEPPPQPPAEVDEEPAPATTAPAPASGWAARADAVCADAQGEIDALPQPTDAAAAAAQVAQISAIVRAEITELRDLRPRPGTGDRVERFLGALGRGANALDRLEQAMLAGDEEAVDRFIGEGQAAADEAQRHADALGLTVCGRA